MPVTLLLQTTDSSPEFRVDGQTLRTERGAYEFSRVISWTPSNGAVAAHGGVETYLAALRARSQLKVIVLNCGALFGLETLLSAAANHAPTARAYCVDSSEFHNLIDARGNRPLLTRGESGLYCASELVEVPTAEAVAFFQSAETSMKHIQLSPEVEITEITLADDVHLMCLEAMLDRFASENIEWWAIGHADTPVTKAVSNVFFAATEASATSPTLPNGRPENAYEVIVACNLQDTDTCRRLISVGTNIYAAQRAHDSGSRYLPHHRDCMLSLDALKGRVLEKYNQLHELYSQEAERLKLARELERQKAKHQKQRDMQLLLSQRQNELEAELHREQRAELDLRADKQLLAISCAKRRPTQTPSACVPAAKRPREAETVP